MSVLSYEDIQNEILGLDNYTLFFETDFETSNNSETMNVFLDLFYIDEDKILCLDGTYAEIYFNDLLYSVHASGNGTFSNHKIEFVIYSE